MEIISIAPTAAVYTNTAAAASTTSQVAIFNVQSGEPGAGSQLGLNLPGSGKLTGEPFRVLASGLVVLTSGTYTATFQPLIYASTSAGFTASAAAAIYSPTAVVTVTVATTTTKNAIWNLEIELTGDTTSGLISGVYAGSSNVGVINNVARAIITNAPTSVNFNNEPPLQFSAGVTVVGGIGAGTVGGSTLTLQNFVIEA